MLFKEIVDARTTDNGPSQKLTFSTLCSGELKTTKWINIKWININLLTQEAWRTKNRHKQLFLLQVKTTATYEQRMF